MANDVFSEVNNDGFDDDAAYEALAQEAEGEPTPEPEQPEETGEAATAEGEGEAEQKQEGQEAQETEERPTKTVPLEALHEARYENRELRDQLNQLQHRLGTFESLKDEIKEIRSQRTAQQQQDEQAQFDDDPVGYMKNKVETLEQQIQRRTEEENLTKEQQQQLRQQYEQQQKFMGEVATEVSEFIKSHEDYPEAFKYLMEARTKEYQAMGIKDPNQINQMLDQEAMGIAAVAKQNGRNPGEAVYELAQARGYKHTKAQPEEGKGGEKGDTLSDQLAKLEKGQKAAQTLSGGGKANTGDISLADLDQMSDEELDAFFDSAQKEAGYGSFLDE